MHADSDVANDYVSSAFHPLISQKSIVANLKAKPRKVRWRTNLGKHLINTSSLAASKALASEPTKHAPCYMSASSKLAKGSKLSVILYRIMYRASRQPHSCPIKSPRPNL